MEDLYDKIENFLRKHSWLQGIVALFAAILLFFLLAWFINWFFGPPEIRYYRYGCGKYYPNIEAVKNCELLEYESGKLYDSLR